MRVGREEYDAAAATAAKVFEAIIHSDSSMARDCFLPECCIFGQTGERKNIGPCDNLLRQIDTSKVGPEFNYRVDVVAIEDTIALVQVLENNYNGNYYTVYLTEMKVDGQWKICSFVYNFNEALSGK